MKSLANMLTLGAVLENTELEVPEAHCEGIKLAFVAHDAQSTTGVAIPTHVSCCRPVDNPVLSTAPPRVVLPGMF